MSKKPQTDQEANNREEAELWKQFASPERETEYDLNNPETLNAMAAYAEGRGADPGRGQLEQQLLQSEQALDDLAFMREMEKADLAQVPAEIEQRASSLVNGDEAQSAAPKGLLSWLGGVGDLITGKTLVAPGWAAGVTLAGIVTVALIGFQMGMGIQQQQMLVENLMLSEFPVALNYDPASAMTSLGGEL
jgi:hypothetical protein